MDSGKGPGVWLGIGVCVCGWRAAFVRWQKLGHETAVKVTSGRSGTPLGWHGSKFCRRSLFLRP